MTILTRVTVPVLALEAVTVLALIVTADNTPAASYASPVAAAAVLRCSSVTSPADEFDRIPGTVGAPAVCNLANGATVRVVQPEQTRTAQHEFGKATGTMTRADFDSAPHFVVLGESYSDVYAATEDVPHVYVNTGSEG